MVRSILKYNPSPRTPLPGERGGAHLYFKFDFNWGEGLFSLIAIFLLSTQLCFAQTFPVRVTPILQPPYTPFLSDYTDSGAEKLTVQIMLNDLTINEFRTKLRLTIEGVGITITSNPNYFPPPITLHGGVPQLVYGSDIADYFKTSNLIFQGLNPNDLVKSGGKLPEGIYRISFEVLDYNRNTVVSNKGSATAWMILNDPPIVNLPVNNAKIKPINPQNIVFQWTPRHRGSPNAAFTTDYDLKLVEIWPSGRNPYDAINTSRPILETTTSSTLFVFGPEQTPLVLGREYALQIRARDTGGKDVFKNNGYSEVVRFVYGDECPMPTGSGADNIGTIRGRLRWQGSGQNTKYQVRYREKKDVASWFEEKTERSYLNLTGLRAGTVYEYQMLGECDDYQSDYNGVKEFTTLIENPDAYVCSDPNSVIAPDGSPPLRALFTNDSIHAGGFDVIVTSATGSNGIFTGEGLAEIPWFNSAKVRVTYRNIAVNTSYQLTAGDIKSVWDPNSRSMLISENNIDDEGNKSDSLAAYIKFFEPDTLIVINGIILSAYNDPDDNIVIETNEGRTVLPKGPKYAIADEAGNGYIVEKDGKIQKTTATDALAAGAKADREYATDPNLKISFLKGPNMNFGLDEPQTVLPQNYQQTVNGERISWKALATGTTDKIIVASQGEGDITKAKFKLGDDGQLLNPESTGTTGQQSLGLLGKNDGRIEELLAYYPNADTTKEDVVAGKLNMVSYNLERRNLVLISVNGTPSPDRFTLQNQLNDIYLQGVVNWTVKPTESITVNGINESNLDDGGSGLLSNYTEDMKKVIRAYTNNHTLDNDTYYLFLVKNSTSKNKLGYMPRKKQAGFIFVDAHEKSSDLVSTMAHELGHGAFRLKHTFSEYPALAKGITQNLMDYPAQSRLDKWQWDYMHNPEAVLGLFEDDEEGALVYDCPKWFSLSTDCESVAKILEYIKTGVKEKKALIVNWNLGKEEIVAENIVLDGVRYDKIKIVNSIQKEGEVTFDPSRYDNFSQDITMVDGKTDQQRGFVFKTETVGLLPLTYFEVITVLLYQENDFEESLELLRAYLFETTTVEGVFLQNIQWISQFDETIFGLCTGCWTSSCCRRAAEYMMGNTNIANCTDSTIAVTAPYMSVSEKIITASFSNNAITYTTATYNSGTLSSNSLNAKSANDYMKERLDAGKVVLIGVHYTNGTSTPPKNANRATRHFMVVVGYGKEGSNTYFRFYDPGRSIVYQESATSPNNKLIYNSSTGFIQGNYFNKTYTITEVSKTNQ